MTDAIAANDVLVIAVTIVVVVALWRGRRLEVKIGSMHAQLSPNGGSSALDLIRKTNEAVEQINERVEVLEALDRRDLNRRDEGASS